MKVRRIEAAEAIEALINTKAANCYELSTKTGEARIVHYTRERIFGVWFYGYA